MQDFAFYFKLGWEHIISWDALDHILFVLALAAIYLLGNWKQVLVLVTAFTIGHSLTLALSVYEIITVNDRLVEFLIPCTIVATAIFNFLQKDFEPRSLRLNYFLALFFGLIHGLGFANTIRFMLAKDQSIGWSLFAFNIGLEAGQIVVVISVLLLSFLLVNKLHVKRKWWVWALSGIAFCIALKMVSILYKWLLFFSVVSFSGTAASEKKTAATHPIFMSVTDIEHNAKDKTLEISCKIFTDDFEKTLRHTSKR